MLARPKSAYGLAVFRIAFGGILLWESFRYLSRGWIERFFTEPEIHFRYFAFEWVPALPAVALYGLIGALGVMAASVAVGFAYRVNCALLTLGWSYVFLLEQATYLNHMYLVCMLCGLMTCVPAHRAWSLDARRRDWRPIVPAWSYWLLRFQLAVVYIYAGIAKIHPDWLQGQPLHTWLQQHADAPLIGGFLASEAGALALSWGGLVFDLAIVWLLLCRRTRMFAVLLSLVFHLTNTALFSIGIFPWTMLAATTLFFAPDWPLRWRARSESDSSPEPMRRPRPWALGLLVAWAAFQVFMPLRHHLYPGDVTWTEEGHRFSWRMKLRSKRGRVTFFVEDPRSGLSEVTVPADFLTPKQARAMGGRPEMILQAAHHLRDRFVERHGVVPEVRVRCLVTLNHHPPRPLIDPNVDLAREHRSLAPAPWILR